GGGSDGRMGGGGRDEAYPISRTLDPGLYVLACVAVKEGERWIGLFLNILRELKEGREGRVRGVDLSRFGYVAESDQGNHTGWLLRDALDPVAQPEPTRGGIIIAGMKMLAWSRSPPHWMCSRA
ncbi:MAG: hypothetical protein Q9212_000853, partial [Teloschistes hypoglaucus]